MAYLLPTYTDPRSGAVYTNAYARIRSIEVIKADKWARTQFDIYASKELRETPGKTPVSQLQPIFSGNVSGNPDNYTSNFSATPVAVDDLPAPAANVDDIAISQAYLALKTHPDTAAILAAATVV